MNEVRFYKGKYRVEVLRKSKGNYLVRALEPVVLIQRTTWSTGEIEEWDVEFRKGWEFTTVPRLLWTHPRK